MPYDQAIRQTAEAIQRVQAEHGNDAMAMLSGASLTTEKTYLMGKFARLALKTANNPDDRQLALHWSRPVRLVGDGEAELITTRGSGDIISTARSDGFVDIPANRLGPGPWPFYRWGVNDE